MGQRELGRYCKQAARWFLPEMWKKWWRKKKKISKMRAHCKSKSDEQRRTCGCCKKKTIKKVVKALKKASKAHAGQAKALKGVINGKKRS